jgi:hypothetical protein
MPPPPARPDALLPPLSEEATRKLRPLRAEIVDAFMASDWSTFAKATREAELILRLAGFRPKSEQLARRR